MKPFPGLPSISRVLVRVIPFIALGPMSLVACAAAVVNADTPPARAGHTMIYDPVRDRMILFGGRTETTSLNDVWELPLADTVWHAIFPAGTPPFPRTAHMAFYDPVRDRMIVSSFVDVWELTLAGTPTWNDITPAVTPPGIRSMLCGVYDSQRDRMVALCKVNGGSGSLETWELSLSGSPVWTRLATSGDPVLTDYDAVYDPALDGLRLHGISPTLDGLLLVGQLPFSTLVWSIEGMTSPRRDRGFSLIYDSSRARGLVFAGFAGNPLPPPGEPLPSLRNDTWSLGSTVALSINAPRPAPRRDHAAAYDPLRDRMIVFGGDADTARLDDTWALSLGGVPRWSPIAVGHLAAIMDRGSSGPTLAVTPNPSTGPMRFELALSRTQRVRLAVFDPQGRRVATLVDGVLAAGRHPVSWGAGDPSPAAGLYFVRMETQDGVLRRRFVIVR